MSGRLPDDVRRPQRVRLAAAQRRHPDQPPAARRHAPLRRRRRGRPRRRRRRRRRQRADPAAGPGRLVGGRAWTPDRSGTPTPTGSATNAARTPCTGPSRGRSAASDPVPLGSNNSGRGVGGSMVHYAGYTPRFHPSDFHTLTADGVGADWPIGYADLRPYYEQIEAELPVAGQDWPWGDPHGYPHHAHPVGGNGDDLPARRRRRRHRGAGRAGGDHQRPLRQPAALHLPRLLPAGLQGQRQGQPADHPHPRRAGPRRRDPARLHGQRGARRRPTPAAPPASPTSAAGSSTASGPARSRSPATRIETPRLLLLSATERFPDGLGNDHDQVGRYLMVQGAPQTAGRFADEIRMYKAPPPEVSSEQFYETDPTKPYQRGWSIQTVSPLPITWAEHVTAQGHWGEPLREYMRDYVHWATLGALCEFLPAARQPGHPGRREGPARPAGRALRLQPVRQRQAADEGRAGVDGDDPAARPAPRRSSPSTATPTSSAAPGWPPRAEDGVVDADHRIFGVAQPVRRRRQRAADPGLGQPGADDHGAGRPGRRPAGRPAPRCRAAGDAAERASVTGSRDAPHRRRRTGVYTLPDPGAGGRRHARAGTRPPPSPSQVQAGGATGLGWTYSSRAAAAVIDDELVDAVRRPRRLRRHRRAGRRCTAPCRNLGTRGLVMQAISAVDIALWDLKARLLDVPLARPARPAAATAVPVYGSGGFTTLDDEQLPSRSSGWPAAGCTRDEDQDRRVLGRRPRPRPRTGSAQLRELAGDGVAADGRRQRRLHPRRRPAGSARRSTTSASSGSRSRSAATTSTASPSLRGALALRCRRRRVRRRRRRRQPAAAPVGRLPAARRHPLRRLHRLAPRRAAVAAARTACRSRGTARPSLHAAGGRRLPNLRHVEWFVDHARLEPQLVDGAPRGGGRRPGGRVRAGPRDDAAARGRGMAGPVTAATDGFREAIDWETGTISAQGRLTVQGADLIRGAALSLHRCGHAQITVDLQGLGFADDGRAGPRCSASPSGCARGPGNSSSSARRTLS